MVVELLPAKLPILLIRFENLPNRRYIFRYPLEKTEKYFKNTLDNIKSIATSANTIGANFVLVIVPRFQHWNPDECPKNAEADKYSLNEPFQFEYFKFFEARKGKVDFDIYNLLPAFKNTKEFPLILENDPHWNENGHAFVAKTMVDYLIQQNFMAR